MTTNGKLPDFILIPDKEPERWHLFDRHGAPLFEGLNLRLNTLLSLVEEAGAKYQITIPLPTEAEDTKQTKGKH